MFQWLRLRPNVPTFPVNIASETFSQKMFEYYAWAHAQGPVCQGRVSVVPTLFISSHQACLDLLKDRRFVRSRSTATGKRPIPMPRRLDALTSGMIQTDGDTHRRLRGLVAKAFTPRAIQSITERVEDITDTLLNDLNASQPIDLIETYALPIPTAVIAGILGLPTGSMPAFQNALSILTEGFSGLGIIRTFLFDINKVFDLVENLIEEKRKHPQEDILSALIQAEEAGDTLTHDELVSTVLILIIAGYETTVHLIANSVLTLLRHPEQLALLLHTPSLIDSAVEELIRFAGPIHGTKPQFATEDLTFHGVDIPRGYAVIPLLGAANRDPAAFSNPNTLDIARNPRNHIGFGHGPHFCLGAALARMETRIALIKLLQRFPNLKLSSTQPPPRQNIPLWYRHASLPVLLQPS